MMFDNWLYKRHSLLMTIGWLLMAAAAVFVSDVALVNSIDIICLMIMVFLVDKKLGNHDERLK